MKTELNINNINSEQPKNNNNLEINHIQREKNYENKEPKGSNKLLKVDKYKDILSDLEE